MHFFWERVEDPTRGHLYKRMASRRRFLHGRSNQEEAQPELVGKADSESQKRNMAIEVRVRNGQGNGAGAKRPGSS